MMKRMVEKNKSKELAQLKAKKLHASDTFKNEVRIFRKKWNIPFSGIKNDDFFSWKVGLRSGQYVPTEEDLERQYIRTKRESERSVYKFHISKNARDYNLRAQEAFDNDIGHIMNMFGLNTTWFKYLETYLITNKKPAPPHGIVLNVEVDKPSGQEVLRLTLTEVTRRDDLVAAWKTIKKHQVKLSYYNQRLVRTEPAFARNENVYRMKEAGKSTAQIITYLESHYPTAEAYTSESIRSMIYEYKKSIERLRTD